jgi:hypothetical protein
LSLHCIVLICWSVSFSGKKLSRCSFSVHTVWTLLLDRAAACIHPSRVRGFWSRTPTSVLALGGMYPAPDSGCAISYLMKSRRYASQTRPLGVCQTLTVSMSFSLRVYHNKCWWWTQILYHDVNHNMNLLT